jgi:hypothetical protein
LIGDRSRANSNPHFYQGVNELKKTIKAKKRTRREWTAGDLKTLRTHSRQRTPVLKISKQMKRTIGALRVKASELGLGLGHQR